VSRPYSESELADQLDSDLTWRIRELSDLKSAIKTCPPNARSVLLRSLVTMTYAHWEGHVRFCASKYFDHIAMRRHHYNQLDRQFYINSFISRLEALYRSKVNVIDACRLIANIMHSAGDRFSYINPSLVDTKSNLNSDVIKDLCTICSVDAAYFDGKKVFIDKFLLGRRNLIAHGSDVFISIEDMDELVNEGVALMRSFKDLLQNKVFTRAYFIGP